MLPEPGVTAPSVGSPDPTLCLAADAFGGIA